MATIVLPSSTSAESLGEVRRHGCGIEGRAIDPVSKEEEYFEYCPDCEQSFDARNFNEMKHHGTPGHAPIPIDS